VCKKFQQIAAAYVSPYQYDTLTCGQIAEAAQRVSSRAQQAAGVQDQKAAKDAVATTVGVIIFWPALLMISGNDEQTAGLARLRDGGFGRSGNSQEMRHKIPKRGAGICSDEPSGTFRLSSATLLCGTLSQL
jgi:hypothetical protein